MNSETDRSIDISDPFARRLMARYLERRTADVAELRRALAEHAFEDIALTGHHMYGSGAAYGLDEISLLGRDLEAAAGAREVERIGSLIDALEAYVGGLKLV